MDEHADDADAKKITAPTRFGNYSDVLNGFLATDNGTVLPSQSETFVKKHTVQNPVVHILWK